MTKVYTTLLPRLFVATWQRCPRPHSYLPARHFHGWPAGIARPSDLRNDNTPTGSILSERHDKSSQAEEDTLGRGDAGGKLKNSVPDPSSSSTTTSTTTTTSSNHDGTATLSQEMFGVNDEDPTRDDDTPPYPHPRV
eukprot:scaffold1513_cov100-Amphora_coffeaeformis.AAC.4